MREIIFRGKRLDADEWVEGFFSGETCDGPFDPMYEQANIIKKGSGYWYKVHPSTVGQYTGLKDKSGKLIFEGDVFEWGYAGVKEFRYVVVYDVELASFVGERHFGFVSLNRIDIEIIGNIHDNPELLEGGNP